MNDDEKVRVSLEQALEVQNALRRNGLKLEDLKILTNGQNMAHAVTMLRHHARDYGRGLTKEQVLLLPLEKIFTEEVFTELGLVSQKALTRKKVLTRILLALRNENVYYVGDLVQKNEAEFCLFPNMGKISLMCVKDVLKKHDLYLGMILD